MRRGANARKNFGSTGNMALVTDCWGSATTGLAISKAVATPLRAAVYLQPGDARHALELARSLLHMRAPEDALAALKRALKKDRESLEIAVEALGLIEHLPDGKIYDAARKDILKAVAQRSDDLDRDQMMEKNHTRPATDKKITIGYICNELHQGEQGAFLTALLSCHDRSRYEIHLYHESLRSDTIHQQLVVNADRVRKIRDVD